MDILTNLASGFGYIFTPVNLLYVAVGVSLGTFVGVLPGIGSLAAISILLPISYYLPPAEALILLSGVYYGAEYGGSTTSILLNIPGTPSSAVTCLDGHPMAKQGKAGQALFITTIASLVGSTVAIVFLTLFVPILGRLVLSFGPTEYFSVILFGLIAASTISEGSPVKGLVMVTLGLLLGTIGMDINSGVSRFNFGIPELFDGIHLIVLAMGIFGFSEIMIATWNRAEGKITGKVSFALNLPSRAEFNRSIMPMVRGTAVGSFFGALPGTGQTIASFVSYALEKRVATDRDKFGKGAIEGISSPEAANNAAALTAFIPTLSMGIPGSVTMALMLGVLLIHGIDPGPKLIADHPDIFWALVASFWLGSLFLVILNIPMIGVWVSLLKVDVKILYPLVIILICIGIYSVNNSLFDVGLGLGFGLFGFVLRTLGFQMAPLLIGFVLGPMLETYFRRAMTISNGDFGYFLSSWISLVFLIGSSGLLIWSLAEIVMGKVWQQQKALQESTQ